MAFSTSILRRYTPPTCTLEVAAKSSPLSRWLGQPVLKDLRFELHFDDPRNPEDKRVTIRGGRTELEMLCDIVNRYVQDFLELPPGQLPLVPPSASESNGTTSNGDSPANSVVTLAPETSSRDSTPSESDSPEASVSPAPFPSPTHIQPRGLLGHNLVLGQLATAESGSVVDLSALQLFDLATALDEYAAEMVALPDLNPDKKQQAPPAWTRIAAVALLAVGVTATTVRLLTGSNSPEEVATSSAEQEELAATEETPLLYDGPPPPLVPSSPFPSPIEPPPLSSSPILPPPSPVSPPAPPTGNEGAQAGQRPSIPISPPPQRSSVPNRPTSPGGGGAAASSGGTAQQSSPSSNSGRTALGRSGASTPSTTPPPLPDLPSLEANAPSPGAGESTVPTLSAREDSRSADTNPTTTAARSGDANRSLHDSIPQVAQVRTYFQQRWQPPSDLEQTLEYRLVLNADGSIQRIVPLGQSAKIYIDRTDMPLMNEPFVSPVQGGGNPQIRLVLTPEGEVKTFLENP